MEQETATAFTRVHDRVDKTNDAVLKLTEQVSKMVGVIETQAAVVPKKSFGYVQEQMIRSAFAIGQLSLLGLIVYFYTHSMHGH